MLLYCSEVPISYKHPPFFGGIMSEHDNIHNHIEMFLTMKIEDLSDQELRSRYKFLLPSTNFYLMAAIGMLFGIIFSLQGHDYGPKIIGGAIVLALAVALWQELRATSKSREQLIGSIKRLNDAHTDMDM